MTTLILAMNEKGAAFATDSAVTYGEHSRNSAQKLFSLPGRQPIAIMVMGNGNYAPANLSWSRIIYNYNLEFGEKYGVEFELDSINDYQNDFVNYLDSLESREDNDYALFTDMCGIWTGQDPLIVDGSLGLYIKQDGKNDEDDIYFKISDERKGINAVRNMIQDWIDRAHFMSSEVDSDIHFV